MKTKTMDFGTMNWLSRRSRQILQDTELAFYKGEAEKMACEIEVMIDALKAGDQVIIGGMTVAAVPKS